ncbi:MAG: Nif3-like dinuclear metal center hexameric protein [Saprospiraceae bacterium]|nr:Nif3-like dinuclear metal center hexameric protein [Saprospiraceae bacterium]
MTKISDICRNIEQWAPPVYAEAYDNIGLIAGDPSAQVTRILVCLDSTEEVVEEAIRLGCNLVLAHHPIVFRGLKKFNGSNYVERTIIYAIKNDIAIYAAHTNLDNVLSGVNHKIAHLLGLQDDQILSPKPSSGSKEESIGAGVIGLLKESMTCDQFLQHVKVEMKLKMIKHTAAIDRQITRVAVCGGAGSFLIQAALEAGADAFVTADLKYHEYFDAESQIVLLDIGHFESERFTIDLIYDRLKRDFATETVFKTSVNTNPVQYFL